MQGPEKGNLLISYKIFETSQFQEDLQQIAASGHSKIVQKLQTVVYPQLRQHPHFGPNIKKLKNFKPETWRYRVGAWRFFFEIDEQEHVVFMTAAHHRSRAY